MNPETIFYNENGRIRSGWRFAIYLVSFLFAALFVLSPLTYLLSHLPIGYTKGSLLGYALPFALSFAVAVLLGLFWGRVLEDLPFRALGLSPTKYWFRNLIGGLAVGAASFALAALIALVFGGLSFRLNEAAGTAAILLTLASSLVIFTAGAAFEEAFFRGYLLQTLSRARLAWAAIALTSVFFAAAHLGNANSNLFSTVNTGLAGIWLGVAYLKTRDLWFPFGVHLTWNWFQGAIFGVEVSGLKELTAAPVLSEIDAGPAWLTGADYGIEGGVACTIALVVSILVIRFAPFFKPDEEMLALSSEEAAGPMTGQR